MCPKIINQNFMLKKLLPVLSALILFVPAFALAQTITNCNWAGYSLICLPPPTYPTPGLQQNQTQQPQGPDFWQKQNELKAQYGSAYYSCLPANFAVGSQYSDPFYQSLILNQIESCLSRKSTQQTQPTCPSGSTYYSGTCVTYNEGCQQKYGPNSSYTSTNDTGKLLCDCKTGFTWGGQNNNSCVSAAVTNDNAATANSVPQVAGTQTTTQSPGTDQIGTNIKLADGTINLIAADGTRHPYTSAGAFLSYGFNTWDKVVDANLADTLLPVGALIPPRDGSIFCATQTKGTDVKGECTLITGGQKAAFTSSAVFMGLGFSFGRAVYGDSSFLAKTSDIDNASAAHRPGVLVNNNGTVQLVGLNGLLGIKDSDSFNSYGLSFADVVKANAADQALVQTGYIQLRQPGHLAPQ